MPRTRPVFVPRAQIILASRSHDWLHNTCEQDSHCVAHPKQNCTISNDRTTLTEVGYPLPECRITIVSFIKSKNGCTCEMHPYGCRNKLVVARDDHGVGGVVMVGGLMDGAIKREAMGGEMDFLVGIKWGDGTWHHGKYLSYPNRGRITDTINFFSSQY